MAVMRRTAILLLWLAMLGMHGAQAQTPRPWTGGATPPLALRDLEGHTHRLESYRGKVVLVNFWATWCAPCREEMPSIEQLRRTMEGEAFVVLAVNVGESASAARAFAETMPLGFALLLDPDTNVSRAWGARALPATYIVGADGRIRYSYFGALDWSSPAVRRTIEALLPAREAPGQRARDAGGAAS
jgi:peroxiredoxin